jgi:two-component system, chemotaxis family, CheB/CheR fusion protein
VSPDRDKESNGLEALLEYLKRTRGFDFSGYKRASLERRIRKRMSEVERDAYRDYIDHLEVNPDEFSALFDTILINVTSFFRDKPAWDNLAEKILPDLLERTPPPEPVRVWSAGCASGEEAYTAAIVLAEALGQDEFRRRVKIYATDVDEDALNTARHATYSRDALKPVPDNLVERYFEPGPSGHTFRADLRRQVIFGRNDLVQDAPISRIDLLLCRNTLMYFTAETQAHILGHLNFALNETGALFLGKSEMLITQNDLFTPYDIKFRVFKKVSKAMLRDRLAFVVGEGRGAAMAEQGERHPELLGHAMDSGPTAQLVVDRAGFVIVANQRTRAIFGIGAADIGRPLSDLELSYRPADLRSALENAYESGKPVRLQRIPATSAAGTAHAFDIELSPIVGGDSEPLGASITFADVTELAELDARHERSKRELETAYEELQSTVEELETTNEELHSTNEELETTNEELQSTNEELETMNEELQSTNEELEAMNEMHLTRSDELDRLNMFLEGILGSLGVGVVVVDAERRIQVWNASSSDLWGLRSDEVDGQSFFSLDIGLPVEELKEPLQAALDASETSNVEVPAVTRRGRQIDCWVRVMPLNTAGGDSYGAIMLMADAASRFDAPVSG